MKTKTSSRCDAVTLTPVKYSVPSIPPFSGAQTTDSPLILDDKNDPVEYRCVLVPTYGDLSKMKWKHYMPDMDWDKAHDIYKKTIKDAGWRVRLEDNSLTTLKFIIFVKEKNNVEQYLLVFITPDENTSHVFSAFISGNK